MTPRPGHPQVIGRYRILMPIGDGGMGRVYLARMRGTHGFEREVALKLMHPHLSEDPVAASTFLAEARLLGRIRHPNVVSALDVGEHELGVFIVLDYVEGDSLAGLLKRARKRGLKIPLPIGLRILVDCLSGLHAAHELRDATGTLVGLVHRDFTPHNLLVGLDGIARLTDFGIAKLAHTTHSHSGSVKGKLKYLAPEQIHAQAVDRRTDIFTAGVVAWEISAGQHMIQGENDGEIMVKLVRGERPRLTDVVPDAPADLDDVLARATSTGASSRQQTALELKNDLLDLATKAADHAEVAAWVERLAGDELSERRKALGTLAPADSRPSGRGKLDDVEEDTYVDGGSTGGRDALATIVDPSSGSDDAETPSTDDAPLPGEETINVSPVGEETLPGRPPMGIGFVARDAGEDTMSTRSVGEETVPGRPPSIPVDAEDVPTPTALPLRRSAPPPPTPVSSFPPPPPPPPPPPHSAPAIPFAPSPSPVDDLEDLVMPAARRPMGRVLLLIGIAAVLVVVVVVAVGMSGGSPTQDPTAQPSSARRDPPPRVDVREGASVVVTADQPVARVRLAGKETVFDPPSREARVFVSDPSRPDDLSIVAASGAEKTVRLEAGQKALEVRFTDARPVPTYAPRGPRGPLNPNPYRP